LLQPFPGQQAICFCMRDSESLYRDYRGNRVVADVEGGGVLESLITENHFSISFYDQIAAGFPISFERYLTIAVEGDGDAEVRVSMGPPPLLQPLTRVNLPYRGSGWCVAADGPIQSDHRRELVSCLPAPFFFALEGEGSALIAEGNVMARRLLSFRIDDAESLRACEFAVQNISRISTLRSTFSDGQEHVASVASHLNRASWRLDVPQGAIGLVLRKSFDRFHGLQRARVLVNSDPVGTWFEPLQDRSRCWAIGQFGFPLESNDAGSVEIVIDPPPGTPLWSFSEIEVFAILQKTGYPLRSTVGPGGS
jgi:hypothetical protein